MNPERTYDDNGTGPLVTVLLATYNRAAFLPVAIESVLRQDFENFELFVIRDGGEGVAPIVHAYADARIRFIDRAENRGKAASLNEAIAMARGEYIAYLDDDDIWYPNHLRVLADALRRYPEYGAAYSDLYKTHYRLLPGLRRQVLAKNVEISRDFDRWLMLQFNHVLHVSVMHRRELLNRAGPYNEQLNVLIDWDLTRRLCFYTDFLHVPVVTGEYYAAIENSDRMSIQRRKNVRDYVRNVLTIRSHRPPKPWPHLHDLSVVILHEKADEALMQTLRLLWGHSFYPHQVYMSLPIAEFEKVRSAFPNLVNIETAPSDDAKRRLDRVLAVCEGTCVAIVPVGLSVASEESCFLARSLYPLLMSSQRNIAYEIVEADPVRWGAVFRKTELRQLRLHYPHLNIQQAAQAAGMDVRKPREAEYPFQFDNLLTAVTDLQQAGQWSKAAKALNYMAEHYGNHDWMQTLVANALYRAGQVEAALNLIHPLNRHRPTVARLLIEARCQKHNHQYQKALRLYQHAQNIVDGGQARDAAACVTSGTQTDFPDQGCV
jgi:glycosyltransferase involved in cell wall biosynthesis